MTATIKMLSAAAASQLDRDLMSFGAFSIDQLMELAGLSVAQALYKLQQPDPDRKTNIAILCGTGNNAGDGLRLCTQLEALGVPFKNQLAEVIDPANYIIDALFGFNFSGPVREPFPCVIEAMEKTLKPILSVDVPSSWDVDNGPPNKGVGKDFYPTALISLTAPKPCFKFLPKTSRHFLGGRFVSPDILKKYGLELPKYPGYEQVVEITGLELNNTRDDEN
ncbi:NAD(P)H-hydrate epimerase [Neolecta irregularis DAH-3]|uniref:NAD(P)H-hydrate epimerase n=1 Tax=Neolecta irregularis (strain DAH-3) TaxID=1198029 RepID=A0A1U7LHC3_NEOID|nr:NAD(P)H-hydrate epimerase [Neolecta irregularis DAH-3]|eukprot:OLL22044.1 NAD(P)H-hydrate epimerase [Neolecta irregularis DAH-3]